MIKRAQSITGLSTDGFHEKVSAAKLLLLYPWTTYKNVFLSYIVEDEERQLIYYRLEEKEVALSDWLRHMASDLSNKVDGLIGAFAEALESNDITQMAEALAQDLTNYSSNADYPIYFFVDEVDRSPHNEELQLFFKTLVSALPQGVQLVVSSRLLRYQPWYGLVSSGDAVVLGTEKRINDVMYTVVDDPKPALEVYALGRGYALVNGQEITNWDGALPRNLFFYFVDNPLVTRDQIFDVFWPRLTTKEATNVFHVTKRKISERITMKVSEPGSYELTQYGGGFYTPSDKVIRYYDVHEFEEAVNQAIATVDEDEEEELLLRAIELYKGPFLQDGTMEWMQNRRDELRQLYSQALIGMGRLSNESDDDTAALGYFVRSLKETPEREDIHREVMTIYLNKSMIDDAKHQYSVLKKTLDSSFGIGPSKESRELYELIESRS